MTTTPRVLREDPSREYRFDEGCHILEWSNGPLDAAASSPRACRPPSSGPGPA